MKLLFLYLIKYDNWYLLLINLYKNEIIEYIKKYSLTSKNILILKNQIIALQPGHLLLVDLHFI
jgi:hypothetical protein